MESAVLVVGSANLDVVASVDRLPLPGETLLGDSVVHLPGGKGLNQAAAAASTGVKTYFLGAVGDDAGGRQLRTALENAGVDTRFLVTNQDVPSGSAHILVSGSGTNQIVVVPAANFTVTPDRLEQLGNQEETLSEVNVLVLQGEIPMETNLAATRFAKEIGARTVFNLAPAVPVAPELLHVADPLVVNEFEAGVILEKDPPVSIEEAKIYAEELARDARSVVITLGTLGSVVYDHEVCTHVEAMSVVPVVDTTGAGDAFVGVLAGELSRGADLLEATQMANKCAGATVTRPGAAASYEVIRQYYPEITTG